MKSICWKRFKAYYRWLPPWVKQVIPFDEWSCFLKSFMPWLFVVPLNDHNSQSQQQLCSVSIFLWTFVQRRIGDGGQDGHLSGLHPLRRARLLLGGIPVGGLYRQQVHQWMEMSRIHHNTGFDVVLSKILCSWILYGWCLFTKSSDKQAAAHLSYTNHRTRRAGGDHEEGDVWQGAHLLARQSSVLRGPGSLFAGKNNTRNKSTKASQDWA